MTEYDYSPEAAQRHQEKLKNIGRWAHETGRFAPADPFAPSTPAVHVRSLQADRDPAIYNQKNYNTKPRSRSVDYGMGGDGGGGRGSSSSKPRKSSSSAPRPPIQPYSSQYPPPSSYPRPADLSRQSSRSQTTTMSNNSMGIYQSHPQPRRANTLPQPPPLPSSYNRKPPVRSNTYGGSNVYFQSSREPVVIPPGGYAVLPPGLGQPMYHYPSPPAPAPMKSSWLAKLTGGILGSKGSSTYSNPGSPTAYTFAPPGADIQRSKSQKPRKRKHRHHRSDRRNSY